MDVNNFHTGYIQIISSIPLEFSLSPVAVARSNWCRRIHISAAARMPRVLHSRSAFPVGNAANSFMKYDAAPLARKKVSFHCEYFNYSCLSSIFLDILDRCTCYDATSPLLAIQETSSMSPDLPAGCTSRNHLLLLLSDSYVTKAPII